jgi:iron complex outermembrane recepter protein
MARILSTRIPGWICYFLGFWLGLGNSVEVHKLEAASDGRDLLSIPLSELLELEVTTPGRTHQRYLMSPAAVHVLSGEEIRRSGARTLPDLLRLVPGMQVARLNANQWAVSARGFNGRFANELLVMIDGRTVYTPLFSGVFWEVQDPLFEDIDRIEVVRGPGGAMWGANAVNGVINIITKSSARTQGGYAEGGFGTLEQGFGAFRYGGRLSDGLTYRYHGKYSNRETGPGGHDDWRLGSMGARVDWTPKNGDDLMTFDAGYYEGDLGQRLTAPTLVTPFEQIVDEDIETNGAHFRWAWEHELSRTGVMKWQVYFDRTERSSVTLDDRRDTFDLEGQHQFEAWDRHEIVWGGGYRLSHQDTRGSFEVSLEPPTTEFHLFNAFIKDQITLLEDRWWLSLGTKLEHHDHIGFNYQPSLRTLYALDGRNRIWGSIQKAVRTPSTIERTGRVNDFVTAGPTVVALMGSPKMISENLIAYELGYRAEPTEALSLDTAFFYNDYDNLLTLEPSTPFLETSPAPAHLVVPFTTGNELEAETYGAEVSALYQIAPFWRIKGTYSYLEMQLHRSPFSRAVNPEVDEARSPAHQWSLWSRWNLPGNVEVDAMWRYVDELQGIAIRDYLVMDLRVAWRPHENLELSIVGQNLFEADHPEFAPNFIQSQSTEIEQSVYGKVSCRF